MNQTIKTRIEQIGRGEVPEGYRKTKAGIMPDAWLSDKIYKAKDVFYSVTNKKHNGQFEVLSATQDRGVIPRSQVDIDIKYSEESISGYKKVDKGDFVISLRSFQGGIEYSEYEGLVSPAYTVLKNKLPICDGYYKAYFKTNDYINRLNKGTYGIRDGKQVGFEDFGDMVIHYPSLLEQERIAEILDTQDKLIALKEKRIAEKKQQKKYLMQQLLTGKKRLPGFTGEWGQERLCDFCGFIGGGTPDTKCKEFWEGDIPWLSSSDIEEGNPFNIQISRYITREAIEKSATKICPQGTILIVSRVGVGKIGLATRPLCTSQDFTNLLQTKHNNIYLIYALALLLQQISTAAQGTSIKGIPAQEIKKYVVQLPSIKEQQAIADILSKADKEIELLQKDLEEEKTKKKALMQLLLTGIVRVV